LLHGQEAIGRYSHPYMITPTNLKKAYSIDLHKIFIRPNTPADLIKVVGVEDKFGQEVKAVKGEKVDIRVIIEKRPWVDLGKIEYKVLEVMLVAGVNEGSDGLL
jgi:hypothetical protein